MGLGHDGNPADAFEFRPRVRFSAVGEGWGLFKARWPIWIVAGLIILVGNWALLELVSGLFGRRFLLTGGGFRPSLPPRGRLTHAVVAGVVDGVFLGGLFRMACLQVRGRRVEVSDLFEVRDVMGELVIGSALVALAVCVAGMFCVVPAFFAAGVLMFVIPLIVDGRLRAVDAVGRSWRALKGQWLAASAFHLGVVVLAGLGGCCTVIGLLVTLPLYSLSVAVLYRDFFLSKSLGPGGKATPFDADF